MRAKFQVQSIRSEYPGSETIQFVAVGGTAPYGPAGESEDNTFARYTPSASLSMTITNPALLGTFTQGQKFYADFTPVE